MSTIQISSQAVAFSDKIPSNKPLRKNFDWQRNLTQPCINPKADFQENIITSHTFFNGEVATAIDNTTLITVTLSPLDPTRYRFSWVGGTKPAFREDRTLALSGNSVTVVLNPDATVNFTLSGGTWAGIANGDNVFIPGATTGDGSGPFNVLNEGVWVVLNVVSPTNLQCARLSNSAFQATGEVVAVTANSQVLGFSALGVQVSNGVDISSVNFAVASRRTMVVAAVTANWFEVLSTTPVPLQINVQVLTEGMTFFSGAKNFLRVECDQEAAVQLNGDTGTSNRISPLQAGDPDNVGWLEKWGPVWSVTVVNRSSQPMQAGVFTAESV